MTNSYAFRCLWLGQSLANSGDVFYVVGLMTIIYGRTGSAVYMAMVPFCTTVSRFLSGLMAPLIFDRFGLKRALTDAQGAKTLLLLALSVLSAFNVPYLILVLLLLITGISFLDGWAAPARGAFVPHLVKEKDWMRANSFLALSDQSVNLAGWACGGILAGFLGGTGILWITFGLFVLSTVLLSFLPRVHAEQTRTPGRRADSLREGWRILWHRPLLRVLTCIDMLCCLSSVVWMAAIIYVFVRRILRVSESWWGYINFVYFAGLIVGGFLALRASRQLERRLGSSAVIAILGMSLLTAAFAWNAYPLAALLLAAGIGIFEQILAVAFQTLVQKNVPTGGLAKVYAAQDAVYSLVYGMGTLFFGWLVDSAGVRLVFIFSAILLITAFLFAGLKRRLFIVQSDEEKI
ncbi:MAG: MFS transporter [Sporolactobacillus sp.]